MKGRAFFIVGCLIASGGCSQRQVEPDIRPSERAIVDKALEIYGKGKVDRTQLLNRYNPVVVYLPDMTCVGINLKAGIAGGDTTICFDRTGKQVVYYINGD